MESQALVTIIPWTFIAMILNLFIQMYLIKRFLFKPVHEILAKRQEKTDAELNQARNAREEAEKARTEYESSIRDARGEAGRILEKAEKDAKTRAESITVEAQQYVAALRAKAEEDVRAERQRALNEVKDEIGGLAMDIAGKVVEKEIHESEHKALIDDFLRRVEEAS